MYFTTRLAILFTFVIVTGCAATTQRNLPVVAVKDIASTPVQKTKVYSKWEFVGVTMKPNEQVMAAAAAINKKALENALASADCCVIVESRNEADVVIDAKVFGENNPAALLPAFITGLSLYTIPSWVTATAHIEAKVSRGNGSDAKTYDLKDSMTMYQWLPLVFAMPFRQNPISAGKELDANVFRNLVKRMQDDRILQ